MEETKRQKQVGKLVQQEMSNIFQREGVNVINGGMVSVSKVAVTPDLMEARIYLSFFQIKDRQALLDSIVDRTGEWRNLLGQRVKNQLRRVPELQFYIYDTLDYVFKMEEVFKKLKADDSAAGKSESSTEEGQG
jgi:ribosome-binding factor A